MNILTVKGDQKTHLLLILNIVTIRKQATSIFASVCILHESSYPILSKKIQLWTKFELRICVLCMPGKLVQKMNTEINTYL